jgi:large subunit ribosomal protein L4
MRRLALRSVLSAKAARDRLRVIDELSFEKPQTKEMKQVLAALGFERSTLVVTGQPAETVKKSVGNLPNVSWLPAAYMNVLDLLNHQGLLMTEDAVKVAEAMWGGERATSRRAPLPEVKVGG